MAERFDPSELFDAFRIDAEEQLRIFAARLEVLRVGSGDEQSWSDLYRAVHTVKGGGALLGLRPVADLAEAMCHAIRRQRVQRGAAEAFWQDLGAASAALERIVWAATAGEPTDPDQIHPHLERLAATT